MSASVVYFSLVIGAIGSLFAIVVAARSLLTAWQNKAVEDAENTKAIKENTDAIYKLNNTFSNHEARITDLERRSHNGSVGLPLAVSGLLCSRLA